MLFLCYNREKYCTILTYMQMPVWLIYGNTHHFDNSPIFDNLCRHSVRKQRAILLSIHNPPRSSPTRNYSARHTHIDWESSRHSIQFPPLINSISNTAYNWYASALRAIVLINWTIAKGGCEANTLFLCVTYIIATLWLLQHHESNNRAFFIRINNRIV